VSLAVFGGENYWTSSTFLDPPYVNRSSISSVFDLMPLDPFTVPTVVLLMECNIQYEDLNFVKPTYHDCPIANCNPSSCQSLETLFVLLSSSITSEFLLMSLALPFFNGLENGA
jgi:hypothetical protein